jgi:signal transduction histidine kinase
VEHGARLARLIRERTDAILARWEQEVRGLAVARALDRPALFDSMPRLVEQLARAVELGDGNQALPRVEALALEHARQRLDLGYELGQLVAEYAAVRIALIEELKDVAGHVPLSAWVPLVRCLDASVAEVSQRFSKARERKLHALERISSEVVGAPDLETMLAHVVDVLAEAIPELDEVTILLREGDELRVRASRGVESHAYRSFSIAVGKGFAGAIAATGEPLLVRDVSRDPLVESEALRALGLRALYGVPLVDDEQVVGVAHVGSKRASDIQGEDMILFRGIANRVAALLAVRRRRDDARATAALREQFIAVLGHDLRSPLHAILGSTHVLLRRARLDEADRRAVERIARAGERMERLTRDLLDFTRVRLGEGLPLERAWIDLTELARSACEEAELGSPGARVTLASQLRSRVFCDADRVAQLLSNLLSNAHKHGSGEAPVRVTLDETAGDAVLAVHNEGPPIPADLLPHVFDAFRHGESGPARGLGLGLGLYIARAIVVAHGGSIEASSNAAAGTTFVARLPKHPR